MKPLIFFVLTTICVESLAQPELPVKVSHAEPVFFDLVRDLGARKGEKELNVGMGMTSFEKYRQHTYFVEYEFAPVNRLGLEIELPFAFHPPVKDDSEEPNGLEGIKAAFQYSFFVSRKWQTTIAAGYIFESLSHNFRVLHPGGSKHNPFLILARRWGKQFHSFVFAGPAFERTRHGHKGRHAVVNAGVHYVLPQTGNFIGLEANGEYRASSVHVMLRPQVKLKLMSRAFLGAAVGIPANRHDRQMDFLFRWIYEPAKKIR